VATFWVTKSTGLMPGHGRSYRYAGAGTSKASFLFVKQLVGMVGPPILIPI